LIWVETPSTDLGYGEWSLRTADLRSHRVREIAHSRILKHGSRLLDVFGGTYPVVIGDWVHWATAIPTVDSPDPQHEADWEFDIQRARLSKASATETVARNAVMPGALDDALCMRGLS
jgi:hypothetical protein